MTRLVLVGNQAFSLVNFRGPLIADLAARGVEVFALAPDYADETRAAVRGFGAEPVDLALARTGLNPLRDLATLVRLWRLLRRLRPDAVLGYAAKPVIYGLLAAWLAGVPRRFAMIEGLGYVFIEGDGRPDLLRAAVSALYRLALRRATRVFFLNADDLADFRRWGLVGEDKALNIGGIGVDLKAWAPAPPVTRPITFLLAARLLGDKGIREFAAAARLVRAAHPDARFVLLGGLDSNPRAIPEAEVEGWVREGLLEWPGHVPVRPWLERASVFVLPSYREGVPRSTQEAMAMARPVITTDVPGCRDTVIEGGNGFLVPPRDADALAAAMRRFIDNPALIATMGARSRQLAEERFDVGAVNALIIAAMGL